MLPTDKLLHLLVGAVIGFCFGLFFGIVTGLLVSAIIGALKELYDHYHPDHTVDFYDWLATFAGSVFSATVLYLSQISI